MPAGTRARVVRVEEVMGTVVSFDIRPPLVAGSALDAACAVLHDIDRRFSLYRPDSEFSRLARGELAEAELSEDARWVLTICDGLARTSGGAFDARRHRLDGIVDPSGFVKGWAVEQAARRLDDTGASNYAIAAGGDVLTRGAPAPGEPWRVGIRHPGRADRVAAVLAIRGGALATSGLYERGDHILDPRTGDVPRALVSLTVTGPDLGWADAYATAAFAMGLGGAAWVEGHPGYGAVAITADGLVSWTRTATARRVPDAPEPSPGPSSLSGESHVHGLS
jgi:thiamine biosynthesis lipoprotein